MEHSPVVFLLGFGRIASGLLCTAGSDSIDLLCLNIYLSLLLCLSLPAYHSMLLLLSPPWQRRLCFGSCHKPYSVSTD